MSVDTLSSDLPPKKWSRYYVRILDQTKGVNYEQKAIYSGVTCPYKSVHPNSE